MVDKLTSKFRGKGINSMQSHVAELNFIKKIVAGVGGILMVQFFGAIWWAATITTNMEFLKNNAADLKIQIASISSDRYGSADAKRDLAEIDRRIREIQAQVSESSQKIYDLTKKNGK